MFVPPTQQEWADTDTTTALWRAISSGDKEALETLLDADEKNGAPPPMNSPGPRTRGKPFDLSCGAPGGWVAALHGTRSHPLLWLFCLSAHVRAADGRGPLWWAHEHKNEEAIELLQAAGVDEGAKDRGGCTRAQAAYHPSICGDPSSNLHHSFFFFLLLFSFFSQVCCCLHPPADGFTAAQVGAELAGQKTKWAIALEKKQAEEAAKREAELAEAHAKQAAAGDDEWDEDWDEDEEVRSRRNSPL